VASRKKKRATDASANKKRRADAEIETRRAGLPAPDSIISETTLTSPKGNVYRILKTDERDAYDPPAPSKRARRKR
jgi:hypothetical protein